MRILPMRYVLSVTERSWTERNYVSSATTIEQAQEHARNMAKDNIRVVIRSIPARDSIEMWYRLGLRELVIDPPDQYRGAYNLGKKTAGLRKK